MEHITKTKFLTLSIIILSLIIMPQVMFAKGKDNSRNKERGKDKKELSYSYNSNRDKENEDDDKSNSSRWNVLERLFKARTAEAQTAKNRKPVISGITSPTVVKVNTEATWTINAYDPENGSLSYFVDWGDITLNRVSIASEPVFVQEATFSHEYSAPGVYRVSFMVKDDNDQISKSTVTVRVIADTSTLVISDFNATSTKPREAKLVWMTDQHADSKVWYSKVSPVDTSVAPSISLPHNVKKHKINLKGLEPDTTYYVVVSSKVKKGNASAISGEISFKTPPVVTPPPANHPPTIVSFMGPSSLAVDEEGTWEVNAFDPENSALSYMIEWGDEPIFFLRATAEEPFIQTTTFTHSYADAGTYTIKVSAKDEFGYVVSTTTSVTISEPEPPTDSTPPLISEFVATSTGSQAVITWTTDEPATSKVYYSTTTPMDVNAEDTNIVLNTSFVTAHSITLDDLATSTTYYVRVESDDVATNSSLSQEFKVTTLEE